VAGVLWHHRQPRKLPSLTFATLIACGALLYHTHRVPFARVWQFLRPLYCIACGTAMLALLRRLGRERFAAGCAVVVATCLVVLSVARSSVAYPDTLETLRSAPQVTALLKQRLKPGDRVLAAAPAYGPLLFYFVKQDVDTAFLTVPMPPAHRAYVVVAPRGKRPLDWAVGRGILDAADLPRVQLVQRFDDAEVWTIDNPLRAMKGSTQ
jgi:hypothetical protein